jgi:hypothetical protein
MFKRLITAATCLALAACVTARPGYDAAQWRKDHRECSAKADRDAQATATVAQKFQRASMWAILDPSWRDNPFNGDRLNEAVQNCMTIRGYPAERK